VIIQKLYKKINRKLSNYILQRVLFFVKETELRNDKNNNLNQVDKCFASRINDIHADPDKIRRIVSAYQKAIAVQAVSEECFQVGNEWLPIYEKNMGSVMSALKNGDIKALQGIYDNFMRHPSSAGLHGMPADMQKCYFSGNISLMHKKWYLYDFIHRINLWKGLFGDSASLEQLDSPMIGNPYGCFIDGHFIKVCSDYQHYYATCINRLTSDNFDAERRVIIELGGGFGGMSYYFNRDSKNKVYVDIDLPENLALASFYLMHALPEKKVFLFGEGELTEEIFNYYDIIMLPNFEVKNIPTSSTDLVFNSYSLAEMSENAISCYVNELSRALKPAGYFYHVNHTRESLVKADDFGIEKKDFVLLHKTPALWNAARNLLMDENEYLYQKVK
jgi:putative sugar O-methyltransferase